jgi:hypothetical protein
MLTQQEYANGDVVGCGLPTDALRSNSLRVGWDIGDQTTEGLSLQGKIDAVFSA